MEAMITAKELLTDYARTVGIQLTSDERPYPPDMYLTEYMEACEQPSRKVCEDFLATWYTKEEIDEILKDIVWD